MIYHIFSFLVVFALSCYLVFREFTQNKDITRFSPQKGTGIRGNQLYFSNLQLGEFCKICPDRWNKKAAYWLLRTTDLVVCQENFFCYPENYGKWSNLTCAYFFEIGGPTTN